MTEVWGKRRVLKHYTCNLIHLGHGHFMDTSTTGEICSGSWKTSPHSHQEAESCRDGCNCRNPVSACDGNLKQPSRIT